MSITNDEIYAVICNKFSPWNTWCESVKAPHLFYWILYLQTGSIVSSGTLVTYHPVIDTEQGVDIYDPIAVRPPIVAFPWLPKPVLHKYKLKATGGNERNRMYYFTHH